LQHHRERERGDREERATQPQRQIAGAKPDQAGDNRGDHDQDRDVKGQDHLHQRGERFRKIPVYVGAELVQRHA
jgi:hypothetical protein